MFNLADMKRRSFVKASLITGAAGSILTQTAMAAAPGRKNNTEFYELRTYLLQNDAQQKIVEDYLQNAAIPALNRLGSNPIGVFTALRPTDQTQLFVLIPYSSLDDYLKIQTKLAEDAEYIQKSAAYINAPLNAPAYQRIESSLLQAFTHMPKIEAPEHKPRIFELRRYESPTEYAGKKKIDMFNKGGEIGIFKRIGCRPVFYGETLIGNFRPNLTYMLTFDDMDAHDRLWKAFGSDPEWNKLKTMPEYPDALVSHITSTFLMPVSYSQI
jgi:hypothetical protein